MALREETVPAVCVVHFPCALVSFPDQWVWYFTWDWDFVCACVQIWKWHPSQRTTTTECCEWFFIDQGEFEAMKTLSGWKVAHCDEHPFRAKIKVSAWTIFELSLFDKVVWTKKYIQKWHFHYHTLFCLTLLHGFWPLISVLVITNALKEEAWVLK